MMDPCDHTKIVSSLYQCQRLGCDITLLLYIEGNWMKGMKDSLLYCLHVKSIIISEKCLRQYRAFQDSF